METNNPSIFVVEDNEFYNDLIVTHLAKQNFTNVKSFYNGEECVKNIKLNPDIIIQDYNLPGITGIDVLIRAKKVNPAIEFIFLSAQESVTVAANTIKYGAYDYVVKDGVVFDRVIDKIRKIIAIKKLERQNKILKISMVLFFIIVLLLVTALIISIKKGIV